MTFELPSETGGVVTVRLTAQDLRATCSGSIVPEAFLSAVSLFNAGDAAAFSDRFAPDFRWFSVYDAPTGEYLTMTTQEGIASHVTRRHEAGEQMLVDYIEVAKGWHGDADLVFKLRRHAPDRPDPERTVDGKAVYLCASGQFFVWSMADAP